MIEASRIEQLRELIMATIELKQIAGGFCENFEVKKTWFLCEELEESYDEDCEPVGTVWICPRPAFIRNLARHNGGQDSVEEELTVNLTMAFPRSQSSEEQVGVHVRLLEELTDTIRRTASANGYGFMRAEPARDDWGTPYLFVNMEKGSFFTILEFRFMNTIP